MKVVIAGGRDFIPTQKHVDILKQLHEKYKFTEIVSGAASDADSYGERFAAHMKIPLKLFLADWKNKGSRAGHFRNSQMGQYCDAAILFKGGNGTKSMRHYANFFGKPILYDEEDT